MSDIFKKIALGFAQAFGFGLFFIVCGFMGVYFLTDIDMRAMVHTIGAKTNLYVPYEVKPFTEAKSVKKQFLRHQSKIPDNYLRIHAQDTAGLYEALNTLNQLGGNGVIIMADGVYNLNTTLMIMQDNIMIVSLSANPYKVTFKGLGNQPTGPVHNIIKVEASNFTLDGITLTDSPNHLIQIAGELDADNIVLRNNIFQDSYEQLIKISYNLRGSARMSADNGIIENNIFQYTRGVANNYYTGGIDGLGAKNWYVEGNVFRDIASPSKNIAQYAVHFWVNSENNVVTNNIFIDNDRSIGFGLLISANNVEGYEFESQGGKISDNYIFHTDNNDPFADAGIVLEASENAVVNNNVIYQAHSYPNAIEYRFAKTKNLMITDNVTNQAIQSRNDAQATVRNNTNLLSQEEMLLKLSHAMESHRIMQVY